MGLTLDNSARAGRRRRRLGFGVKAIATLFAVLGIGHAAHAQTRPAEPRSGGQLINTIVPTNVREMGQGPAIVLIHGLSAAMDWWDPIVSALAEAHRVVTIDLLGHGGTAAPETGYEVANNAALVRQAMEQFGVTSATIVGHSYGGLVATAIAEQFPEVVERLVIMNTPSAAVNPELAEGVPDMPLVGEILAEIMTDDMVRGLLANTFAPGFVIPDAYVADARRLTFAALQQTQAGGEAYRSAMAIHLRVASLPAQPAVLVIMSELDAVVLPTDAALWGAVPNARVEVIPGIGHSPMIEAPARTAELIAAFVAETQLPVADAAPAAPAPEAGAPAVPLAAPIIVAPPARPPAP